MIKYLKQRWAGAILIFIGALISLGASFVVPISPSENFNNYVIYLAVVLSFCIAGFIISVKAKKP